MHSSNGKGFDKVVLDQGFARTVNRVICPMKSLDELTGFLLPFTDVVLEI